MYLIISYILITVFFRLILLNKLNSKKVFVIIAGSLLFILAAFRSINFGPDVIGYVDRYISLSYESIHLLWNNFVIGEGKDPFFYLFSKIISAFGLNYQIWLAILSGIFIYSVSRVIYRYSEEPFISFTILISLGYLYFSLTGLRQALALSILLLSYEFLRDRKLLRFIFMVIIASLFHSTALVFLIAYPLANMKIGIKHILGIIAALILATFFKSKIKLLIQIISWSEQLSEYGDHENSLTLTGFIIQLSIFLFCLFYRKEILKSDIRNLSLYNLLFLGLVFQAFSTVVAEFFRISMYFSIFGIVLIPKAINKVRDKNIKVIVYLSIFSAFIAFILWTGTFNNFDFFWND